MYLFFSFSLQKYPIFSNQLLYFHNLFFYTAINTSSLVLHFVLLTLEKKEKKLFFFGIFNWLLCLVKFQNMFIVEVDRAQNLKN